MNDLISREALRNVILNDRKLDGSNANWEVNRILAHIDKAPAIPDPYFMNTETLENSFICGYRVKDLIIFGKMFHDNGITREQLIDASESFLAGYRKAHEEINESIKRSIYGRDLKED